eukprot:gene9639-biopygen7070
MSSRKRRVFPDVWLAAKWVHRVCVHAAAVSTLVSVYIRFIRTRGAPAARSAPPRVGTVCRLCYGVATHRAAMPALLSDLQQKPGINS